MKAVNKILAAVDLSTHSLATATYAAQLARDVKAEMVLVNVYNQRDIDMLKRIDIEYPQFSFQKYLEENIADRRRQLAALIDESRCAELGIKVSYVVRKGVPYEEVLEEIKNQKADLLIMATKGRSNLVGTVIGSCAQKLFRRSPIPVLSLRDLT